MTELLTHNRPAPITARPRSKSVAANIVSGNQLATHFECSRQNAARLTAAGIIGKLPDGRYNQDLCRLKYFARLRSPDRSRSEAASDFAKAKTELIRLRSAEEQRDLIRSTKPSRPSICASASC